MTPAQLTVLNTELKTDPRGYGFRALVAASEGGTSQTGTNDTECARLLGLPRDGTAGTVPSNPTGAGGAANGIISIRRPTITRAELLEAIDTRDLKASPTVLEGSVLESILQTDAVTLFAADGTTATMTKANLNRLVTNTNGSQTRLNALGKEPASRAAELLGYGATVSTADVGAALGRA